MNPKILHKQISSLVCQNSVVQFFADFFHGEDISVEVEIKKSRHQVVPNTNSPENTQSLRSRKTG